MATPPKKSSSRTTPRKPAPRKPAAAKATARRACPRPAAPDGAAKAMAKPAPLAAAPEPPVEADAAPPAKAELTKKVLFTKVAAATGAKKKDVRLIAEATLAVLGQALSEGEDVNLQPLGKLRVVKARDAGAAEVLTLKLRRRTGAGTGLAPGMAEADGDSETGGDDESGEES